MDPMEGVSDALRGLQANMTAQALVLKALIATHPDPSALLDEWRRRSSAAQASVSLGAVTDAQRRPAYDALSQALQQWEARLAERQ